ncbi:hypothetical protein A8L34_18100 [Bacillus sp. FJAT-27264]|uniref:hypothetical protein n=1 Tax=Paenibacillus sp. (strain DSM 101736 / FJAT-27264) TaxID=1850362 RepID=UPI000807AA7E|nr:hypothetical protein [Bacillus sp. FJAT-27264]OBZ10510.1 hypothetical protein A8L34_18100 [Bacillus sp. FJAT-27264]
MAANHQKKRYFVSAAHVVIQNIRNESNEFEVHLNDEELTILQDLLTNLESDDDYTFRRAFVPFKSADHDDAAQEFDDQTIALYRYLYEHGSNDTRQMIKSLNVLTKLENTAYQDKGYGGGTPLNK